MPTKVGIHVFAARTGKTWIPTCVGMTAVFVTSVAGDDAPSIRPTALT
jgi:hypothetical protein